jgi:hypothetical protein
MLADTFMLDRFLPAADLKISEEQRDALIKTLALMEAGKIHHISLDDQEIVDHPDDYEASFDALFNLSSWIEQEYACGTVACIGGTAELISGVSFDGWDSKPALKMLFNPADLVEDFDTVTTDQAAKALRGYLTTGTADWET